MSGQYHDGSAESHSFAIPPEGTAGYYDGTSSDSRTSSPLNNNGFENFYGNGYMTYPAFPYQFPPNGGGVAPLGLIPVELDIEGLYEDHDRRRRKNGSEKIVPSHVHSRRRAQNRASQRAFRDRKEKHMRELEQRLGELESRHEDLTRSYESLQVEYSSVKQELDILRKENDRLEQSSSSTAKAFHGDREVSKEEFMSLFDVSAFYDSPNDRKNSKE